MSKKKTIVALSTLICGRRNYVAKNMRPCHEDQKTVVDYTHDPEKARDFITDKMAMEFVKTIKNPAGYMFTAGMVEVSDEPVMMPQEEVTATAAV